MEVAPAWPPMIYAPVQVRVLVPLSIFCSGLAFVFGLELVRAMIRAAVPYSVFPPRVIELRKKKKTCVWRTLMYLNIEFRKIRCLCMGGIRFYNSFFQDDTSFSDRAMGGTLETHRPYNT